MTSRNVEPSRQSFPVSISSAPPSIDPRPSIDSRPIGSLIPDEEDDVAPWKLDDDESHDLEPQVSDTGGGRIAARTAQITEGARRIAAGSGGGDEQSGEVLRRKLISVDAREGAFPPRRRLGAGDLRGGGFSRRKRWKERLVRKLGPGKNNLREYLRAEGSLRSENLTTRYLMESLHHVFLDYHNQSHQQTEDMHIRCKGGECPDFQQCSGNFTSVDACHCPDMEDLSRRAALPPLNCPRIKKVMVDSPLNIKPVKILFDPNCSHAEDDIPHFAWVSQMFNLRHVYFNSRGQAFNDSFLYDRNGCGSEHKFDIPEGTRVTVYDRIINLAHWNAYQFYHGILELVPVFFMLSKAPHLLRALPIAVQYLQMDFLEKLGTFFIGMEMVHMDLRVVPDDEVFFAHQVLQPYYQWCGRPSRSLWRHFRRLYLLPPDGLPMFLPDWAPRVNSAMQSYSIGFPGAPADWVVVLAQRYNTRALEQHGEVEELLCTLFPRERVVVFDGSLRIADGERGKGRESCSPVIMMGYGGTAAARGGGAAVLSVPERALHARIMSLQQRGQVEGLLCSLFPWEWVVVFEGSLRIADANFPTLHAANFPTLHAANFPTLHAAKALFRRPVLFVAAHGAAITNAIFMPFKLVLLELRPRDFHKACTEVQGAVSLALAHTISSPRQRPLQHTSAFSNIPPSSSSQSPPLFTTLQPRLCSIGLCSLLPHMGQRSPMPSSCRSIKSPPSYLPSSSCQPPPIAPTSLAAKALFNRAVLFVAAHGAAITNAIFMPFKSVLLELRPRDFHKACYHHLAEVCDLQYLLLLCEGAKDTPLSCDMGEVRRVLEEVQGRVDKVLEEGPEVQLEEEEEEEGQR
ncbi:unnamed protein product [Closterium sp. Naga37s-1]|nr:unnamed protein product [Closterium sp. Naga37s-1]